VKKSPPALNFLLTRIVVPGNEFQGPISSVMVLALSRLKHHSPFCLLLHKLNTPKPFKYRINATREGYIFMSVTFPEYMLDSFLSFLSVKEKQAPSISYAEMRERMDLVYRDNLKAVASVFDRVRSDCPTIRAAISATLAKLHDTRANISYDSVIFFLRKAGRLKGSGI
jgi:hypothetical protein